MFNFAWPWLLALLPLPWLIHTFSKARPRRPTGALHIPFYSALTSNTINTPHTPRIQRPSWRVLIAYLIVMLLIVAIAGPQWLGKPINTPQRGRNLMMAIDLSGSMQLPDMELDHQATSRLAVVKHIARAFIQKREGDRLGLILFGTRAYLQTPLTFDRKTVTHMLEDASIGLAGRQTAIGDAIGLAIKRLLHVDKANRVLILLTDGVNNAGHVAPLKAAKLAAANHIRIYTIGIGSNRLVLPGLFGAQTITTSGSLDQDSLRRIAALTGGRYFRANNTNALAEAYHDINRLEPTAANGTKLRPITPLYPWPLAIALCLTLLLCVTKHSTRRHVQSPQPHME